MGARRLPRLRYYDVTTDRQSSVIDWCGGRGGRHRIVSSRSVSRSVGRYWMWLRQLVADVGLTRSTTTLPAIHPSIWSRCHLTTCPCWFHRSYPIGTILFRCADFVHGIPRSICRHLCICNMLRPDIFWIAIACRDSWFALSVNSTYTHTTRSLIWPSRITRSSTVVTEWISNWFQT